jgi:DNA-binding transcriptional MerR regulator
LPYVNNVYILCLNMADALHGIKSAVRRSGLTAHVIRIWEKRYGAVEPLRTPTNRRLYSEDQVERLCMLRDLTHKGFSIGPIAKLPAEKLTELLAQAGQRAAELPDGGNIHKDEKELLQESVTAVKALDAKALERVLKAGSAQLGAQGLLQRLIAPLTHKIGDLWRDGTITAAHEHFASAVIRVFLGDASRSFAVTESAPVLVVATPSGQLHELGALLVSAAASNLGWHVTYLGASLPPAEIAAAARQNRARAVALSLVYPEDDQRLEAELGRLRELLPADTDLLVGGRAMPAYQAVLKKVRALQIKDLTHLASVLDHLRKPAKKARA